MSEEKQHRTPQEIQQEYTQVCAAMGDSAVKINQLQKSIDQLTDKVKHLNFEMIESNAHFAKLQKELEEKKASIEKP